MYYVPKDKEYVYNRIPELESPWYQLEARAPLLVYGKQEAELYDYYAYI